MMFYRIIVNTLSLSSLFFFLTLAESSSIRVSSKSDSISSIGEVNLFTTNADLDSRYFTIEFGERRTLLSTVS